MKKILILVCSVMLPLAAYSQGVVGTLGKNSARVGKGTASKTPGTQLTRKIGQSMRNVPQVGRGMAAKGSAFRSPAASSTHTSSTSSVVSNTPVKSNVTAPGNTFTPMKQPVPSNGAVNIEQLEQRLAEEKGINVALQAEGEELTLHADFGKSVLLASSWEDPYMGFSVTVFKTNIAGKEEIFGIIPSHGLPRANHLAEDIIDMNGKEFSVLIKQADGTDSFLPARLVQISPESMLDISLVKFSPEAEQLVRPLELADTEASINEVLFSLGYAGGNETKVSRTVNDISLISLRTNQTIEGDRQGFCGGSWLNANDQLVAVHTGSVVGIEGKEDVSFGTHVRFVRLLVDAYLNDGKATYDVVLDGHHLATLNIDEYISDVMLFDSNGSILMKHHFDGKFSQSTILNALRQHPNATSIELISHKASWKNDKLVEDRSETDSTKRIHHYNLQTQQIEPARPAVIKN